MTTKITERMMLEAIATGTMDTIAHEEFVAWAKKKIEQLDKKNAKAKERAAEKKAAADTLTEQVYEVVGDEFEPISEIASRIEGEDVTVGKVQYRLGALFKDGRVEKEQITVEDEDGKKRKVMGYRKA